MAQYTSIKKITIFLRHFFKFSTPSTKIDNTYGLESAFTIPKRMLAPKMLTGGAVLTLHTIIQLFSTTIRELLDKRQTSF